MWVWVSFAVTAQAQDVEGAVERSVVDHSSERERSADDALQEIKRTLSAGVKVQERAERDGDLEQVQCVKSRVAAIRTLLEVSRVARQALFDAETKNQAHRAAFEFRKIAVTVDKARQYLAEAEGCMGTTSPEVTTAQDVIGDLGLDLPSPSTWDLSIDAGIPPPTSPFQ